VGIPWLALVLREVGATSSSRRAMLTVGYVIFVVFMGFLAFLTIGIGEALARELWHRRLAAFEIGGDFYDVYALDDSRLAFALGDVAGHGISSGLVMSTVCGALRAHFRVAPEVQTVFESINAMLCELADRRLLTTLVYGLYDADSKALTFAGSGHLVWRLKPDGTVDSWMPEIYPLGVRPDPEVDVIQDRLGPGETLILLSDGLIEAVGGEDGESFGFDRLEETLCGLVSLPVSDVLAGILADVSSYVEDRELGDDCTALILQSSPEGR